MKKFMQMLLASFGILTLTLTACSTGGELDSSGDDEGGVVIEEDASGEDVAE